MVRFSILIRNLTDNIQHLTFELAYCMTILCFELDMYRHKLNQIAYFEDEWSFYLPSRLKNV